MTAQTFSSMYSQYRQRLNNSMLGFIKNSTDAADVTAAAFAAAYQNLSKFRGDASFYTWLHAIARNEALKLMAKKPQLSLDALKGSEPPSAAKEDKIHETLERSEIHQRVRLCLRRIPRSYRRSLVDYYVRGCSSDRIARAYRVPKGTVLSRRFKAKRLLREAWAN